MARAQQRVEFQGPWEDTTASPREKLFGAETRGSPWRNGAHRQMGQLVRTIEAEIIPRLVLARGAVLFEPGEEVRAVHFPLDGTVASDVVSMRDGTTAQTVSIGREGAIGGIVSHGLVPAFARAVVQIPGAALRLDVNQLNAAKVGRPRQSFRALRRLSGSAAPANGRLQRPAYDRATRGTLVVGHPGSRGR